MTTAQTQLPSLPSEIVALVSSVVARTRLRTRERQEIERELTAHFRDGLESGQSAAQLVAKFGDARESSRQLRAGAIAKRSSLDRTLRQLRIAATWTIAGFTGLYGASVAYLSTQKPVISFDPIARFQAQLPKVAESDRAWPVYKAGLIALADPASRAGNSQNEFVELTYIDYGAADGSAFVADEHWEQQCKVLAERAAGIELLCRAARLPALGYVPSTRKNPEDANIFGSKVGNYAHLESELPMVALLLPQLPKLRQVSKFLASDALFAIEQGDGARFVRDIDAIIGLSMHSEEDKTLISQLVGNAIRAVACERTHMALEWHPEVLTDEQLKGLATRLKSIPDSAYRVDLSMELLMLEDVIQRTFSDDGNGDGVFNPAYAKRTMDLLVTVTSDPDAEKSSSNALDFMLAPLGASLTASRKETMEMCKALYAETERQSTLPLWQENFDYETQFEQMVHASARAEIKWMIPRLLVAAVTRAASVRRTGESTVTAALTAIALEQYRRAHGGNWPAKIDDLVPEFMAAAPLDPYTGQPVSYSLADSHPLIWSVSENRVDQQGVAGPRHSRQGDWVWVDANDGLARWR